MAKAYKIAGQLAPAADTNSILYTVPANGSFVESTLSVCNRNKTGTIAAFRIAVVPSGGTLSDAHYLVYDDLLDSRKSRFLTLGLSLGAGDQVYVRSSTSELSFSLFGVELT